MRLIVRPCYRLKELDLLAPYAVISITDPPPFGEPAKVPLRAFTFAVGRWAFADVQNESHPHAMNRDHANGIRKFVERWRRSVGAFVVHCNAGVSRSPSIAMAIADGLKLGRACIDWAGMEHAAECGPPNALVYERMMVAYVEPRP